uniref:Uncharacterized protein n=1 Tax=Glossina morsitans morsitans TaxID=37546 RepID=A0A1B0FFK7_GLOMM
MSILREFLEIFYSSWCKRRIRSRPEPAAIRLVSVLVAAIILALPGPELDKSDTNCNEMIRDIKDIFVLW